MTVVIYGKPGEGKTTLLETLRKAGWYVSSESEHVSGSVSVVVQMPAQKRRRKG